jgi:integrase
MAEKKLLDRACDLIRVKHYSIRTEQTYLQWMKDLILFHNKRHPAKMGAPEVETYLTHLAVDRNVRCPQHTECGNAGYPLPLQRGPRYSSDRHQRPARKEGQTLTCSAHQSQSPSCTGTDCRSHLLAKLLYGTGMRLLECLRLRLKDSDFGQHLIIVRNTKGNEDRVTLLPEQLEPILQEHLIRVKALHQSAGILNLTNWWCERQ